MADHDTHDHTGIPGCGSPADIVDLPTAETDASLVLAPDGIGGVEFRAEAGGGGGAPLGITRYHSVTDTSLGATSSSTQADVDATNAKVTFTAPASGNVIVQVACLAISTVGNTYLGLRESTTNVVTKQGVAGNLGANALMVSRSFYLTGVSAGSHTYKLAFAADGGSLTLYTGPTFGDVEMTVWAA